MWRSAPGRMMSREIEPLSTTGRIFNATVLQCPAHGAAWPHPSIRHISGGSGRWARLTGPIWCPLTFQACGSRASRSGTSWRSIGSAGASTPWSPAVHRAASRFSRSTGESATGPVAPTMWLLTGPSAADRERPTHRSSRRRFSLSSTRRRGPELQSGHASPGRLVWRNDGM